MPQESIRTLIVHDEPSTRKRLRGLLAQQAGVEVVAECDNAYLALRILAVQAAELLFLKASLPGADELQRLGQTRRESAPAIVLLPSRNGAEQENDPLDYDQLRAVLDATRSSALETKANSPLRSLADVPLRYAPRLAIEQDRHTVLLDVRQIHWIDALGNYVKINCGDRTYTLRETMKSLQERLDPALFVRIHRSTILNIEKIEEIQDRNGGGYLVVLAGGRKLAVSRRRRDCLDRLLK